MITDIVPEEEFRKKLAFWLLDNDSSAVLPQGMSREEYASEYILPDFEFEHTQSSSDPQGNIITLLKSCVELSDWETKKGKKAKLTFYRVMKTFASSPDSEPYPMGYIIVE